MTNIATITANNNEADFNTIIEWADGNQSWLKCPTNESEILFVRNLMAKYGWEQVGKMKVSRSAKTGKRWITLQVSY